MFIFVLGTFYNDLKLVMASDFNWVIVEIDGKISAVSPDFSSLVDIAQKVTRMPTDAVSRVTCYKLTLSEVHELSARLKWEDLKLFGSKFQLMVWENLFKITHSGETAHEDADLLPPLLSYTDFADLCGKREGVRAVAHAVAQNPAAIIVPCHLIVPKETVERLAIMRKKELPSLFGTRSLLADPSLNFGEYRYGTDVKRSLIMGQDAR